MSCECENKKRASELERISSLARKMAIIEQCIFVVRMLDDGTYSFNKIGFDNNGLIIEYRHYL